MKINLKPKNGIGYSHPLACLCYVWKILQISIKEFILHTGTEMQNTYNHVWAGAH